MRVQTPLNLGGRAAEVDLKAVRARTPPGVWHGAEEVNGASAFFGARAHRGVSEAAYRENIKHEQLVMQMERQNQTSQRTGGQVRRFMNSENSERTSPSHSRPGTSHSRPGTGMSLRSGLSSPVSTAASPVASRVGTASTMGRDPETPESFNRRASMDALVEAFHSRQATRKELERKATRRHVHSASRPKNADADLIMKRDLLVEEFNEDTQAVERQLENLGRSIRLEHLLTGDEHGGRDKRLQAEKEAEQRRRDQEKRAARKREAMARDPHRKLALKIENKRLYGNEISKDAAIPMQSVDFIGCTGTESVSLVDVRNLRSRCLGLEGGNSVNALLDAKDRRDKLHDKLHKGLEALPKSASLPAFAADTDTLGDTLRLRRPCPDVNNERRKQAQLQKKAQVEDQTLRRLYLMRSEIPDTITERFGVVRQKNDGKQDIEARTRKTICQALARTSIPTSHHRMTRVYPRRFASSTETDFATRLCSAPTVRKHWAAARALVHFLVLYAFVTRRHRAMDKVKVLVKNTVEFMSMRKAMTRVLTGIRKVQVMFREYFVVKRSHLEKTEQMWQQVEDEFLHSYFRLYFKKLFSDKDKDPEQQQIQRTQMRRSSMLARIMDWQKFRIPVKDRRYTIEQYYRLKQKRHVKCQDSFMSTIMTASCWQKDVELYMRQLGAEPEHDDPSSPKEDGDVEEEEEVLKNLARVRAADTEWWAMSEENILALISLLAKGLREMDPFQDHPANSQALEKVVTAPTKETNAMKRSAPAWLEFSSLEGADTLPDSKAAFRLQAARRSAAETAAPMEDLDFVLHRLTPRIKEMAEASAEGSFTNSGLVLDGDLRRPSVLTDFARESAILEEGASSGFRPRRSDLGSTSAFLTS